MGNFYYVSTKEAEEALKSIREDELSAVMVFTEHPPRGVCKMSKTVKMGSDLLKAFQRSLSNRVTCPIYINYVNLDKLKDDQYMNYEIYKEFDIKPEYLPTIVLFKNGHVEDCTHQLEDIHQNGFMSLMNYIKSL